MIVSSCIGSEATVFTSKSGLIKLAGLQNDTNTSLKKETHTHTHTHTHKVFNFFNDTGREVAVTQIKLFRAHYTKEKCGIKKIKKTR